MAKLSLTSFASLTNEVSAVAALNNNNAAIVAALEKTLSRDGTAPNAMSALLDMNTNRIINLPTPAADHEPATKSYVDTRVADVTAGGGSGGGGTSGFSYVESRTALREIDPVGIRFIYLTAKHYGGLFYRANYADYSNLADQDTDGIICIRSTANDDYVWLRDGANTSGIYVELPWAFLTEIEDADIIPAHLRAVAFFKRMEYLIVGAQHVVLHIPAGTWGAKPDFPPSPGNITYIMGLFSNMTVSGVKGATIIRANADSEPVAIMRAMAVPASIGSYVYENIHVKDITFDSRLRPFKYWLSKADGTPITDPEADYVMGTGALASGISGVDLTATLTSGQVTGVTINNGGAGWNGGPTLDSINYAYVPNIVRLKFTGGNPKKIAHGYATISGGTLTSVTIEYPGLGYTSTPTVTTAGGWADIKYLLRPEIDRRNILGYTQVNDYVMQFVQVDKGSVTGCTFITSNRTIEVLGCRDFAIDNNTFVDCGKPDCVNFQITMGDYISGQSRTRGDRCFARENTSTGGKRAFAAMSCTGEQTLARNVVIGCSLLQAGPGDAQTNNGHFVVENNYNREITHVNYGAQCMELVGSKNIHFLNNMFEDCDGQVAGMLGCKDLVFRGNKYRNIFRDTGTRMAGFTSESERYHEGAEGLPQIFKTVNDGQPSCLIVANYLTNGAQNYTFENETVLDNRLVSAGYELPAYLRWFRVGAGSANLAKNITVRSIKMLRPVTWTDNPDIDLFHPVSVSSYPDVMEPRMSLFVEDIYDRAGSGATYVSHAVSGTGSVTLTPGFKPARVQVAVSDSAGNGKIYLGEFAWDRTSGTGCRSLGARLTYLETAGQQYFSPLFGNGSTNGLIQVVDNAGTAQLAVSFTNWTYTGFTINIGTASISPTIHFLCYPS